MTFCVGIQVRDGLVALADTQIVRGSEQVNKSKIAALDHDGESLFVMTSGLRSVRDKAMTYLREHLATHDQPLRNLYRVVNLFGEQLRVVRREDAESLAAGGLKFNTHAIIGGCLSDDETPLMYYVYPEANWIESAADSPYFIIGRTTYAKPILDRLLTYETSLDQAVALALIAFDTTRTSVTDVDCPIDVVVIPNQTRTSTHRRFTQAEIAPAITAWNEHLVDALNELPMAWAESLLVSQPIDR